MWGMVGKEAVVWFCIDGYRIDVKTTTRIDSCGGVAVSFGYAAHCTARSQLSSCEPQGRDHEHKRGLPQDSIAFVP